MISNRRSFLRGLSLVIAAPAVVKAESIMGIIVPKNYAVNFWHEHEKHNVRTVKRFQLFKADGMWINGRPVKDILTESSEMRAFINDINVETFKAALAKDLGRLQFK